MVAAAAAGRVPRRQHPHGSQRCLCAAPTHRCAGSCPHGRQRAAGSTRQHPAPCPFPCPQGPPPPTHTWSLASASSGVTTTHRRFLVQRHQLEGQALAAACGRATGWVDRPAASGAQPPVAQHPPVGRMTRQSRPLSVAATASACSGRKALWPQCRCITLCSAAARCGGAGGAASAAVAAGTDSPRGAIFGRQLLGVARSSAKMSVLASKGGPCERALSSGAALRLGAATSDLGVLKIGWKQAEIAAGAPEGWLVGTAAAAQRPARRKDGRSRQTCCRAARSAAAASALAHPSSCGQRRLRLTPPASCRPPVVCRRPRGAAVPGGVHQPAGPDAGGGGWRRRPQQQGVGSRG